MKSKFIGLILFISILITAQAQLGNYTIDRLPYLKESRMIQVSSYDTTGGNNDRINIHAGETAEIFNVQGPGVITRIWITIDSRDPYFLRRILLRMYWDDEENPSVEVPVGDFFGTGFEYIHYFSQFVGMTSGGYFSYFQMPFNKNARIEVVNETGQEVYAFYYHIDYQKLEEPLADNVAYFHAQWRRDIRTDTEKNYLVLDAEGEGHFVGLNLSMQPYGNSLFYLEGDEMVYVDGEDFPSVYGTGTEDYFTSGWYFKNGEFYSPYHGVILIDKDNSRVVAYRFHVGDAIPFKKSIKFTIEHGHANEQVCDFSSTAYWYQKEPHKKFPEILHANSRVPLREIVPNGLIEAEELSVSGDKSSVQDMAEFGPEWSGMKQLKIDIEKPGETSDIQIPDAYEHEYNLDIYATKGPGYGNYDVYINDEKVGEFNGYNEEVYPGGKIQLENIKPSGETLKIVFQSTGKDDKSSGYSIGIDGFLLTPVRKYIKDWYLIGPFPNERLSDTERFGLDTVYPPEEEIELDKTYKGAEEQDVAWKEASIDDNGFMALWNKFEPYEFIISYALTYVYSPEDQPARLFIGSDDGSKVFLNDEQVYRFLDVRIAAPDQDVVKLNLKKGWNKLLLKLENNFGGYGFYSRIVDKNNNIIISKDKKK